MTPARTALFALAAGLAVGNLYLAQPLIRVIAHAFGAPSSGAGMLVTATQVGYALGIFLVVPLGDVLDRRKLIPGILCGAAGMLLDLAVQANLVLGQTRLMSLAGDARSRLNTAMVVSSFCGGAAGSLIAGPLWAVGGWTAITAGALCIAASGSLVWLASRRTRLAVAG